MSDAVVVVPTYNERENLPLLVPAIVALDLRVLVVDDESPDGTGAVAEALAAAHRGRVEVLHRGGPRGFGRACLAGLQRALDTRAAFVCQMDADLSHDPADLPRLLAAASGSDLVIGSRYVGGGRVERWPWRRVLLSAAANRYVRLVTGLRVRDCTAGYRCWRREALARLPLDAIASEGYGFLVEMLFEAVRHGCRVAEVPIVFVERRQGRSKLASGRLVESALLPWRLRRRLFAGRPVC
ncbi:MAG TPA: polyprenol monophosphomannose synthase [Vicinamibacterales bacterium]|nr:polyprenol monophosphomannose synthase [Vicinamibacterales bacterium]